MTNAPLLKVPWQTSNSASTSVSVCIVTYKRDDVLLRSLEHLLKSSCPVTEILIVDNGHSPELPARLRSVTVPVQLLCPNGNVGCAGLNLAFARASGKYIFCFDDDSFPASDCLDNAIRAFEADPELGMIGFKMFEPDTKQPWHDPWWNPDSRVPRATALCPGCGLAFRNDSRLPSNLCMPDIVSQAHELSMAAEILRLGYRIEFRPDCIAYHPDTVKGYTGEKARIGNQNQMRFLLMYGDARSLVVLLISQCLQAVLGRENEFKFALKYLLAHKRRPVPRRIARQFRDVFTWNSHPRLHRFL
jgi:glycosyltransferase involved in cell wall biosynthesis